MLALTFSKTKHFISASKDNRLTEVTQEMWQSLVSRSDMDAHKLSVCPILTEECHTKLWVDDHLYSCATFDEIVETLVRVLNCNLANAKDFAQKLANCDSQTLVKFGRL